MTERGVGLPPGAGVGLVCGARMASVSSMLSPLGPEGEDAEEGEREVLGEKVQLPELRVRADPILLQATGRSVL